MTKKFPSDDEVLEAAREVLGIEEWWNPKQSLQLKIEQCEIAVGIENLSNIKSSSRMRALLMAIKKLDKSLDRRMCALNARPEGFLPGNQRLHGKEEPSIPDKCTFVEKVMVEEKGIVMEEDLPNLAERVKQIKKYLK